MEQQRLFLFVALAMVSYLIWDAWQQDYAPKPGATRTPAQQVATPSQAFTPSEVPLAPDTAPVTTAAPQSRPSQSQPSGVPVGSYQTQSDQNGFKQAQRIIVQTDIFRVEIDTTGGDLRRVELLAYPKKLETPDDPFLLLNDTLPNLFVAQSGFTRKRKREDGVLISAPNHDTIYRATQTDYQLAPGQDNLTVDLHWTSPEGVEFTKSYTFSRDSYRIQVNHRINNPTSKAWHGNLYQQLQRNPPSSKGQKFIYTYTGSVIYSPEDKYEKIDFDDIEEENLARDITAGWAAMSQHYFLGAWIPTDKESFSYFTRFNKRGERYTIGMQATQETRVAAGENKTLAAQLFVGPKLQNTLGEIAPGLELTVDYGFLTVLSKPLFWLLDKFHSWVNNWGWAIILVTISIKLVFYKLSEASYKSMANMRRMQPRMAALKERFGDDRKAMNTALMDLYKREKINPLGGCLPIVVQIPVFIALYWVLLESVELRQAAWILWIQDMSSPDPYFILPILMGATMLIQHKLNPTPVDPIQAKMMMMLPIVFTVFFLFFPAGLVLYWVANNTLSIMQQWYITRIVMEKKAPA